ncbi:MAG: hypothetical protein GY774_29015 [Planctomycetes bacterium]|nr:hypothetical protein [Planctomycetota bacterium]
MKLTTKHLVKVAFILSMVTVASLGIRQVSLNNNRAGTVESPIIAETEYDRLLVELDAIDTEPYLQYAGVSELDEKIPKDYSEAKPVKGDYAKAKGSKGLQKISLGDNENLYITGNGETWYVSEGPDGKTTKMQVHIDENTGQMNVINIADGKSGGPQPIPMGDGYNMYVTEEGQSWYVGEGSKARVEVDENTGEITVLEQYGGENDK